MIFDSQIKTETQDCLAVMGHHGPLLSAYFAGKQ